MMLIRRILRYGYTEAVCLLLQATMDGVRVLSPRALKDQLGPADTLRIAAAGPSVRESDKSSGQSDEFHVLGVNYFSECADLRLWRERIVFVIEPHKTYPIYVESIRRAAAAKQQCLVILKGFASPKKIGSVVRFVRALSAIPGVTVLLSKDLYIADLRESSYAEGVIAHENQVVSGGKSLLWVLSFGFVAGYKKIVLHGFDFSKAYAYGAQSEEGQAILPNTWTDDPARREDILNEVARVADLYEQRGVQLLQASCSGPLSQLLPPDNAGAC